ncbi:MAG: hypothetical protein JWL80_553, partial [Parcubacteria group bacterium]|nr:hypothetical protein [Parcubacteria group bacterium]
MSICSLDVKNSFRNFFIVICFLFSSSLFFIQHADAAISTAPIQQATGFAVVNDPVYTITLSGTPVSGNVLTFEEAINTTAFGVSTISQTGVVWNRAVVSSTTAAVDIWYGIVGSGAGTVATINHTGSSAAVPGGAIQEWSGIKISGTIMGPVAENSGFSTTPAPGTITPVSGKQVLLISAVRKAGTINALPSGYTLVTPPNTGGVTLNAAYQVASSTSGSYSPTWTFSTATGWGASFASFYSAVVDVTAPSVPSSFAVVPATPTRASLSWASSTDNEWVSYYNIFRCTGVSCTPSTGVGSSTAGTLSYSDTTLTGNTVYGYAISATDEQGNQSAKSSTVYGTTTSTDILPPVLSNGSPTGTVTTNPLDATLSVTTDENATCKYGTVASTSYASIANTFSTTGGTSHSQNLTGLSAGSHTYYVRCIDGTSNANTSDYTITFTMVLQDITAPVISISSPLNGATITGSSLNITATSSDVGGGVIGVQFWSNGRALNTEKVGTNITSTTTTWALTGVPDGPHKLFAVARDAA